MHNRCANAQLLLYSERIRCGRRIVVIVMKKTRFIQILCSLLVGIIFMLAVMGAFVVYELLQTKDDSAVIIQTASISAEYDGTPLTNHQWSFLANPLLGFDLVVEFTGSQTDVGQSPNTATVKVFDENGEDITDQFNIQIQPGTLTVTARALDIDEIEDLSGRTAVNGQYILTSDQIDLVDGHYAVVSIQEGQDNGGNPSETITEVRIYDENDVDVTHNYDLHTKDYEYIIKEVASDNGGNTLPSLSTLLSSSGQNDENIVMYSVYCDIDTTLYLRSKSLGDYLGSGWGEAPVYPELDSHNCAASYLTSFYLKNRYAPLHSVQIIPYIADYGLPYYATNTNPNGVIQTDDTTNVGSPGQQYAVDFYLYDGTTLRPVNSTSVYEQFYQQFVHANYTSLDLNTLQYMAQIIQQQGFSKDDPNIINKVARYIQQAAVYNKDYDRGLDSAPNNAIAFLEEYKEGVCRHYATAATLLFRALGFPARYTIGAIAETQAGQWSLVYSEKAHAWTEVYIDGIGWIMVEVTGFSDGEGDGACEDCGDSECDGNCGASGGSGGSASTGPMPTEPKALTLKPATVTKLYDGTPLYPNGQLIGFEELEKLGYYYHIAISGSRSEVGVSESNIEYLVIFDSRGNDVTSSFDITTEPGRIHVYYYTIQFTSKSITKVYDGENCPLPISITAGKLQNGHYWMSESTTHKHVGVQDNSFQIRMIDAQGNDVTDLYLIDKVYGTATITPASLTLQAGDATKVYDGTPLTCQDYWVVEGSLVSADSITEVHIEGSQIGVGRSDNMIFGVLIMDADGNDVSANYTIKFLPGKLKVTNS